MNQYIPDKSKIRAVDQAASVVSPQTTHQDSWVRWQLAAYTQSADAAFTASNLTGELPFSNTQQGERTTGFF